MEAVVVADKLTGLQSLFVQEYVIDLNATAAAERAGYSAKTANQMAGKLMANPKVQAAIARAMRERSARTEITQDKVLNELARIGFADIKDYLEYKTAKTVVGRDKETGEPIIDYAQIVDALDSSEVDGRVIQEISIGKDGTFKFKLHDKMAALDRLGKHLGMFTDKMEVTGKDGSALTVKLEGDLGEWSK
jgi:phage terminase small subunit